MPPDQRAWKDLPALRALPALLLALPTLLLALPALLLALLSACACLAPILAAPQQTMVCNWIHPDCLSNHWLLMRVAESVTDGAPLLHNDRYYWPVGDAPWLAGNGSGGFFYAPFSLLMPWPMAANAYVLCMLALNGAAVWAWCRALGASRAAALMAAPTGALSIYALHELSAGRFSQADFSWLALFLAAWLRLLAAPSVLRALLAALLLAVCSLGYWYYGLFAVIAGAILLLARPAPGAPPPLRALLPALAAFSAAFLALIGPLVYVFAAWWAQIPGTDEGQFPHPEAVGDSTWPGLPFLIAGGRHAGRALPLTVCLGALAALSLLRPSSPSPAPPSPADPAPSVPVHPAPPSPRLVLALLAVLLLFTALMAGALIPHGPYAWLYGIARPLRRFWWPYRHVAVVNLAWIGLAALGTDALLKRLRPRLRAAAAWALALSIPLQLSLQGAPWHIQFTQVALPHPFYARLASLPGDLLIEPPLAPALASSQTMLIYERMHHKRLLSGHALWVDRVRPDAWDAFVAGNTFLAAMQQLDRAALPGRFTFAAADLTALQSERALIALNPEYFPAACRDLLRAYRDIFDALFGEPILRVDGAAAWDTARWTGATEVTFPPFSWPATLRPPKPGLPLQAPAPPGPVFSAPRP